MAFTYCYKAFVMEDRIYEIEEEIKQLEEVFEYMYLPDEQYTETTMKIDKLKAELEQLEMLYNG